MRVLLWIAAGLVFGAGVPLFVLSAETDRFFAWTIQPPLTAAVLGASFWSACVLEALAARETVWARSRSAVPAVLVFTILTFAVTLYHRDRFHDDPIAWIWFGTYAVVPPVMIALLVMQESVLGQDPSRRLPLPAMLRFVVPIQSAAMLAVGVYLLADPVRVAEHWPWALTPLTGRAIGSWLVGLGVIAAQTVWENDLTRSRGVALSALLFGALQGLALARYSDDVDWDMPGAWIIVLFLASYMAVGFHAWRTDRNATRIRNRR